MGGRHFCEMYLFALATSETTMDILFIGDVVGDRDAVDARNASSLS